MARDDYFTPIGVLRRGVILKFYPDTYEVDVKFFHSSAFTSTSDDVITVPFPSNIVSNELFIGHYPQPGTQVLLGIGEGNKYYIVSMFSLDFTVFPEIKENSILIAAKDNRIEVTKENGIKIGSDYYHNYIDPTASKSYSHINENYFITEASRTVTGTIKRDRLPNNKISPESRLYDIDFDNFLKEVTLDPNMSGSDNSTFNGIKNPPFVEKREIVHEFAFTYNVEDDFKESQKYVENSKENSNEVFYDRRISRANALDLNYYNPNHFIETIKGTVVDIFGNILDLNRNVLNIDTFKDSQDIVKSYNDIKAAHKNALAYHFEINTKKTDFISDILNTNNRIKSRSNLFVDIDKEGQFKINIPASSNTGNIPLNARYENISVIKSQVTSENPNKLQYNTKDVDNQKDIYHSGFGIGSVGIYDDKGNVKSPPNGFNYGISDEDVVYLKSGTVHHNIFGTVSYGFDYTDSSIDVSKFNYKHFIYEAVEGPENNIITNLLTASLVAQSSNENYENNLLISKIITSGPNANAGGRSGSINLDGFLELNIGANTSDRQSLWLDLAGGMLANIGRDRNNLSVAAHLDGDLRIDIGGSTIDDDPRFTATKGFVNSFRAGALDIRVFDDNNVATIFRIDRNGVQILTPSRLTIASNQDIAIRSGGNISLEAGNVFVQERLVQKGTLDTI